MSFEGFKHAMNKWAIVFLENRELPLLKLLDSIWHKLMAETSSSYSNRYHSTCLLHMDKSYFSKLYLMHDSISSLITRLQHIPQIHSQVEGHIRETNGTVYLVHLENRTCRCYSFQDGDSPCSHGIAAIYTTYQAPIDFMLIYLCRTTYLEMYEQNLLAKVTPIFSRA